jgi:hypothetical protein
MSLPPEVAEAFAYADDVANKRIIACKLVQLACERFLVDVQDSPSSTCSASSSAARRRDGSGRGFIFVPRGNGKTSGIAPIALYLTFAEGEGGAEGYAPEGEVLRTFATMTTEANQLLSEIQDRMPVIIERKDWPLWLGEVEGDPAPCSARHRTRCFGSGRRAKRSATPGMTGRSCSGRTRRRTSPLPCWR